MIQSPTPVRAPESDGTKSPLNRVFEGFHRHATRAFLSVVVKGEVKALGSEELQWFLP